MKKPRKNDLLTAGQTQEIALSEDKVKFRTALFIAAVLVAAVSFAYGVYGLFGSEPGLQEITVQSGSGASCGDSFTFYYDLGRGEDSAASEKKTVRSLYSQAAADAYQLFSADREFDGCKNLWFINEHVNQEIEVDPALYDALVLLEKSGTRYHYLAPVYELYFALFQCENDQETLAYDPFLNGDMRGFFTEAALFINDPGEVNLELLGDGKIRLSVSDRYLRFAGENGITRFIDLFWMKNAFIADHIAGILLESGYTRGTLVSRDGFVRHLDDMEEFSFDPFHRDGVMVSSAGTVYLSGAASLVYLHDYPLGNGDEGSYYVFKDGALRFPYADPADGLCKSAAAEIVAYSSELGCAELALKLAPVYISDTLDESALQALAGEGVTVYLHS